MNERSQNCAIGYTSTAPRSATFEKSPDLCKYLIEILWFIDDTIESFYF